jgi:hypothetical protein
MMASTDATSAGSAGRDDRGAMALEAGSGELATEAEEGTLAGLVAGHGGALELAQAEVNEAIASKRRCMGAEIRSNLPHFRNRLGAPETETPRCR